MIIKIVWQQKYQEGLKVLIEWSWYIKLFAIFVRKTRGWCLYEVGPDDGGEPTGDGEDTGDCQENKDGHVDRTIAW